MLKLPVFSGKNTWLVFLLRIFGLIIPIILFKNVIASKVCFVNH